MSVNYPQNQVLYEMVSKRIDQELDRMRSLDTKASNLFGIASAITGFLLGSLNFGLSDMKLLPQWELVVYLLGTGAWVFAIIFCLIAMKIKTWKAVPNTQDLIKEYKDADPDSIYGDIAATMAFTEQSFINQNNQKAASIRVAWASTLVGLVIVFLYASIVVLSS